MKGGGDMKHRGVKAVVGTLFFMLMLGGMAAAKETQIGVIVVDVQGDFTNLKMGPWR